MTKVLTAQLTHITENEQRVFYALVTLLAIFSVLYGVLVKQTIVHVVEREKVQKEMRALNTEISGLETEYMAKKGEITLEFAYANGFVNPHATEYIAKKASLSRAY
jgi:hypothetical protein